MSELREKAIIDLQLESRDAETRLDEINARLLDIKQRQRDIKADAKSGLLNDEQLRQSAAELNAITKESQNLKGEIKTLAASIDIENASLVELNTSFKYYAKLANDAKTGSQEFIAASSKMNVISDKINDVKQNMNALGREVSENHAGPTGVWGKLKGSMGGAFDMFVGGGLLGAVQMVLGSIISFGRESVAKFTDADQSAAQLQASLKSTGGAAGLTLAELNKLATDRMKVTIFDDDDIIKSEAMLLTFTEIKKGIFEEAIPAITNMATKMGGNDPESLKTTTIQVGKALNDPIKGISALHKVGVEFSPVQKKLIDDAVAHGDKAKAQGMILNELKHEFGDSAEAAANASTGGYFQAVVAFGNIQEAIGEVIVNIRSGLIIEISKLLNWFSDLYTKSETVKTVIQGLAIVGMALWTALKIVGRTIQEQIINLGDLFTSGDKTSKGFNILNAVFKIISTTIIGFGQIVGGTIEIVSGFVFAILKVPKILSEIWPLLVTLTGAYVAFNFELVKSTALQIKDIAITQATAAAKKGVAAAQWLWNAALNANPIGIVVGLLTVFIGGLVALYNNSNKVKIAVDGFWAGLKSLASTLFDVGKALLTLDFGKAFDSIKNGFSNMTKSVNEAHKASAKEIVDRNAATANKAIEDNKKEKFAKFMMLDMDDSNQAASQEKQTKKQAAEAKKRVKEAEKEHEDIKKSNEKLIKELEDLQVKAIADDTARAEAKAKLDYTRKVEEIKNEKGSIENKNKVLAALALDFEKTKNKITDDAKAKEDKDRDDSLKKEQEIIKKKAAAEKEFQDTFLKNEKKMLDDSFKQEIAKAKLDLALVDKNSKDMWEAKRKLLDVENAYKKKQLQDQATAEKVAAAESIAKLKEKLNTEAAEEKKRIAESIKDKTARDTAYAAIDLATQNKILSFETQTAKQITAIETKLKTDEIQLSTDVSNQKKALEDDQLKDRKAKTTEFYKGLNSAMTGDMSAFMNFLKQKEGNEKNNLQARLAANMEHIQGVGTAMQTAVTALIALNKKYTDDKIAKLTLEETKNKTKLENDFKNGIITKEQLDKGVTDLEAKFQADALAEKKKGFERDKKLRISGAVMAGSMAVLSALAMPWPVGLAMAVMAGVKAAVDINKIRKEQFQARDGYVSNAGVLQGGRHGDSYGKGGIAMIDRESNQEVGEAEGGEAFMILSRKTTENNAGLIRRLMDSSLHRNGAPITLANGGILPLKSADSYINHSVMQRTAKIMPMWEDGVFSGDMPGADAGSNKAQADEAIAEGRKNSEEQLKTLKEIVKMVMLGNSELKMILNEEKIIAAKPVLTAHDVENAMGRIQIVARASNF